MFRFPLWQDTSGRNPFPAQPPRSGMIFRRETGRNRETRATRKEERVTDQRNKVISEDNREALAGLLRSANQELKTDRRYLGMFEDELHCAQVNSSRDVTGGNRRAGAFYQANFPRSANALQERITAKGESNMGTEMRSMLISNTNLSSLQQLLASAKRVLTRSHSHLEVLEEQLKRAEVVAQDQVPVDVITINSQVRIHDLNVGRHTVYTLVFPRDADVARNRISVLARVGSALLGSRVGDLIECEAPGAAIRMRVREIMYQPEAAQHAA